MIMSREQEIERMWRVLHMNTADIAREIRPSMDEPDVERVINAMLDRDYMRLVEGRRGRPVVGSAPISPVL